jgi:hypothetical protein
MKTKQKLIITLILVVIITGNAAIMAQTDDNSFTLRTFGLGLHMEQFKWNDLNLDAATPPANKMILTFNVIQNLRIEPVFGFNSYTDKDSERNDNSYHIGCGIYGMKLFNRTNIYAGLKLGNTSYKSERKDWNTDAKRTDKSNLFAIGPGVGCEYFFGKHFSIGGEINLKYSSYKEKDQDREDKGTAVLTTDTGLILRFYF